jgi:predicted HTH domain antitoxin
MMITTLNPDTITIQITMPRSLLLMTGLSRLELPPILLKTFILSLYRQDRISSGRAAHLLGIERLTFIQMLAGEGIAYLDYTTDELVEEVKAIQAWTTA